MTRTTPPGSASTPTPTESFRAQRARRSRRTSVGWSRGTLLLIRAGFFVAFLALYQLLVVTVPQLRLSLPTVPQLVSAAIALIPDPEFWGALWYTVLATALGLIISLAIGTALGLLLSLHRNAWGSARFVVDFMRTIPPLALIPLALLVLGVNTGMEVALIVIAAVWPVVLQVYYGIATVEPALLETARMFRMPLWRRIVFVLLPAVSPPFATAVRLSATLSLLLAVGTEVITSTGGLGALISRSQQVGETNTAFVVIIATGLVGLTLNFLLSSGQRRLLHWHYRSTGSGR